MNVTKSFPNIYWGGAGATAAQAGPPAKVKVCYAGAGDEHERHTISINPENRVYVSYAPSVSPDSPRWLQAKQLNSSGVALGTLLGSPPPDAILWRSVNEPVTAVSLSA
jgi:hypothetical protein